MFMIRASMLVACFLAILSNSASAAGSLVSSTFDTDADDWTGLTTDGSSAWSVITSGLAPMHNPDGAPANSISLADPDSQWTYFSAPSKFLGDQSAAFGGSLQFDSRYVVAGTSYANEAEIVLKGAGLTLVYESTNSLPAPGRISMPRSLPVLGGLRILFPERLQPMRNYSSFSPTWMRFGSMPNTLRR
jgi:hypothetical protein